MRTSRTLVWSAWLIASLFYAYQYILRVMPNIMLSEMMEQFGMDAAIFGQFSGAYYLGYCMMHLPLGVLLDRYGPRSVMSVCTVLTVIGLLPLLFATHWAYPILGRFLVGAGSSAAILGAFKVIRFAFKEHQFARVLSFTVTIGLIGALYGGAPVSYLCHAYGNQAVILLLAGAGLLLAATTYAVTPAVAIEHKGSVLKDVKDVLSDSRVWAVSCLAGCLVGPLEGFADAWGSSFLKRVYGFDAMSANATLSLMYIGMCFAPVLSRIAEKTGRYLETIIASGALMFAVFVVLLMGGFNELSMKIAFFISGICCAYQILAIYKASSYVSERISGLTTALANMIIMSFGYIFHSAIGVIIKTSACYGEKASFIYGISFIPIMSAIGILGFCLLAYTERK